MKTKVKKCALVASVACLALSSALSLAAVKPSAYAEDVVPVQDNNLSECEQTLKTVAYDIPSIVSGYNNVYKDADWAATEIEYSSPVFLIEDKEYGMYLDFDASNGYAVITTDKKIYGLETTGDLEYLRGGKEIYYSYSDGFMFVNEKGEYERYVKQEESHADEYIGSPAIAGDGTTTAYSDDALYSEQSSIDDGAIDPDRLDAHVAKNYPGFTLRFKSTEMSNYFECARQWDTSYYITYFTSSGLPYSSEGNCALNAMYNVMRDWGKRKYIYVPYDKTEDISGSIQNDRFYGTYGNKTKTGKDEDGNKYYWGKNKTYRLSKMPILYSDLRSYALDHGYDPESGYISSNFPDTMKYVANTLYQNFLKIEETSNVSTIKTKLELHKCGVLSISGSSTYHNHTVALIGYHQYSKEIPVDSSYSILEHKYFYEVADGWSSTPKIFDPNTSANPQMNFYYIARC